MGRQHVERRDRQKRRIDITIERWSTQSERQALIAAFMGEGQDGLLRALQKEKVTGRVRIPG